MSKEEKETEKKAAEADQDDDEPDEWDKRIFSTGCADENMALTDCHYEKRDWRQCREEFDDEQMERFRACWKAHDNDKRTQTKDAEK